VSIENRGEGDFLTDLFDVAIGKYFLACIKFLLCRILREILFSKLEFAVSVKGRIIIRLKRSAKQYFFLKYILVVYN